MDDEDFEVVNAKDEDFELSNTAVKVPPQKPKETAPQANKKSSVPNKQTNNVNTLPSKSSPQKAKVVSSPERTAKPPVVEDSLEEEINFEIEEEIGMDLLASGSKDNIQFEHYVVKDPQREKTSQDIDKQLNQIQPKFENTQVKSENKNTQNRPATAKPTTAKQETKKLAIEPTAKDLENQKKAQERIKQAMQKKIKKEYEEQKEQKEKPKKTDANQMKQNIQNKKKQQQAEL